MHDSLALFAALCCNVLGLAWFALSMEAHWQQVRGHEALRRGTVLALRTFGAVALAGSLGLCLMAEHPTIAALVWIMTLAAGALAVAFVLGWRSRALRPLVAWVPVAAGHSAEPGFPQT